MNELFLAFANSLTALALCIAVGFVCRRKWIIGDEHVTGMSNILWKVALPCTVFMSLMRPFTRTLLVESLASFVITGVIYILGGYLGLLLARVMKATEGEKECWQFGCAFGNVGFMGIPVVMAVFGADGLIYVSMGMAAFSILAFTIGSRMFAGAPRGLSFKRLLISSPAIPATVIGFLFFLTGFRLPQPLEGGIGLISGMTTPLSMLLIGAILAKQRLKDSLMDVRVLPPAFVKLAVIPLTSLFVLRFFIPNPLMLNVLVTIMAMPAAAAVAIFAEQHGGDSVAGAKFVVVSTVLSVVTVPLISLLF